MIKKVLLAVAPFIIIAAALLSAPPGVGMGEWIIIVSFVVAIIINIINIFKNED